MLLNVKYHNYSEAIQLLDKAILIDSSYYPALANKMTLQLEAQQFKEALGTIKQIERLKVYPELYMGEGLIYYKLGNNDSSNVYLMKALQLYDTQLDTMSKEHKSYRSYLINKGVLLIILNRNNEGLKILKKMFVTEKNEWIKNSLSHLMKTNKEKLINELWSDVSIR